MKKIIIASVSVNGIIGRDGKIPWHSSADLQHFRETTMNHPLIMGRKTFESIGKVLDNRLNIILTRSNNSYLEKINDIVTCFSLEEAYKICKDNNFNNVFIIGGGEVFKQTITEVDELIISRMKLKTEGDSKFPEINEKVWRLESSKKFDDFELQKYVKAS